MTRSLKFLIVMAIFGYASWMYGQAINAGDVTGTVTDPSGAVLPGVVVSIWDVDKNVTHTVKTNGAGVYDTGSIVPDHYVLTFTKQGFATYKRGPIALVACRRDNVSGATDV